MKNVLDYSPHLDKQLIHTQTKTKIKLRKKKRFCLFFFTFPFISESTRKREVKSIEALRIGICDDGWNAESIDEY